MKTSKYKLFQHSDELSKHLIKEGIEKHEPRSIIAGQSLRNSSGVTYMIRKDAQSLIQKIKYKPDLTLLKDFPTNSFQILVEGLYNEIISVDYLKGSSKFIFTFAESDERGMLYFANINVNAKTWTYTRENPKYAGGKDMEIYVEKFEHELLPILIYLFMGDIMVVEVPPNERTGPRHDCCVNDSDKKVKVVTSKWNVVSKRSEGFDVAGHFALRACGVGRKNRKLVFIAPYKKNGYTREASSSKTI